MATPKPRDAPSWFLQLELLDEHRWETRDQLANAIFDWIEAWYNPRRRHSYCGQLSPIDSETTTAAVSPHPTRLLDRSSVGLAPGIATP
jgi:transposase InsO family protein